MSSPSARPALLAGLGLSLLTALLFFDAVFRGQIFFQRDIQAYWYPAVATLVRVVTQGSWPLWDPFEGFGMPLLADPTSQVLYPFAWLNLVLLPSTYYKVFVYVHTVATGLGMFMLARRWGLGALPAFTSGVVWCASGPLLSLISMTCHFAGAAWIPWVLLGLERLLAEPKPHVALILGALGAAQLVTGSADMCVMSGLAVILRLGLLSIGSLRKTGGGPALRLGAVALGFGAALAACQWLPTLELARSSSRSNLPASGSLYWSIHPASLVDMFVPFFTSVLGFASPTARAILFESREAFLPSLYLGAAAVSLALLGLLKGGRLALFGGVGLAFSVLMALGRYALLLPGMLELPGLGFLRYPAKFMVLAAFFWAALVGAGVQVLVEGSTPAHRRRTFMAALLAAIFAAGLVWSAASRTAVGHWLSALGIPPGGLLAPTDLLPSMTSRLQTAGLLAVASAALMAIRAWWRRGTFVVALQLAVVVYDGIIAGRAVNKLAPPALLAMPPPIVQLLRRSGPDTRLFVRTESFEWLNRHLARGPAGWDPEWAWVLGLQEMLYPPIGARWGMSGSFDGDVTGLASRATASATALVYDRAWSGAMLRLLRLGGVTHVVSFRHDGLEPLERLASFESVFSVPIGLWRLDDPLPRAYLVPRARAASETDALALMADPAFDFRSEVIVSPGNALSTGTGAFHGRTRMITSKPDRLVLEVDAGAPCLVVLLEGYHPGWRAWVNDRPADVIPANLLFRAVRIPAGQHRVELRYRPPSVIAGALCSTFALLAGAGVVVRRFARRPKRPV